MPSILESIQTFNPPRLNDCPLSGLDDQFPDVLYVMPEVPGNKRYVCFIYNGISGLAVFSSKTNAYGFLQYIENVDVDVVESTFDEAREIAKNRPPSVVSMMLLDNPQEPIIHYIR